MRATIVIPSHNEGNFLPWTVGNVLAVATPEDEVVVVDDQSDDGSGDDVRGLFADNPVTVVDAPKRLGVVGARNLGARTAEGDHLVFIDAHTEPVDGWLDQLLDPLQDPQVGITTGALMELDQSKTARAQGAAIIDGRFRYGYPPPRPTMNPYPCQIAPGGCIAIRADTFRELGGFDAGLLPPWGSEDTDLSFTCWGAGYTVMAVPDAVVRTLYRKDGGFPYTGVTAVKQLHNLLWTAVKHLDWEDVAKVLRAHRETEALPDALVLLWESDILTVRAARDRNGSWLLRRFGVTL